MHAKNEERQTAESAFENPALVGYLVKKLRQQSRQQIGKTKIQKIVYLLTRKNIVDFDYSMHYYGPYSPKVAEELSVAETAEIIRSQWDEKKGFFLSKGKKEEEFEYLLEASKRDGIDEI